MMTLVAFLQAQNCSNLPGSWRHPSTMPDFLTPEYYQRIARTLEDGKIQMAFFDDRLALPPANAISPRRSQRGARGQDGPLDHPDDVGMVTQPGSVWVTYSPPNEPFHVARLFATMDLMLRAMLPGTS